MPLRLPDQFHRPGVALVRVGDYVKIGLATKAKPVTVLVGNLRIPEALAVGPATFVGAFLTDRPDPSELTETVRREVERLTGEGPVAGDLYRLWRTGGDAEPIQDWRDLADAVHLDTQC